MGFDHRHYVPCLRWKQGEYQAMLRLSNPAKDFITPLVEVPEIGWDFEAQRTNRSVDDHLKLFAKRVKPKWGERSCFVDMKLIGPAERMADRRHPVGFALEQLRSQDCAAIPVTSIDRDRSYQRAVGSVASKDGRGVCIRVSIENAAGQDFKKSVDALLRDVDLTSRDCDLVLDLGAPNFKPVEGFAKLISAIVRKLPYLSQWRTFTLLGTSFPPSMGEIERGSTIIPRSEWVLYKGVVELLGTSGDRLPTFGDYAISHPDVLLMDMRLVKPSATIRYAIDDSWLIVKGRNVRDYKYAQYRDHCQTVMSSPHFSGAQFSAGDQYIANCASGVGKTGSLSTWREIGTSHHLERVARDVSSYFEPGGNP